jgi:hypothetical protein
MNETLASYLYQEAGRLLELAFEAERNEQYLIADRLKERSKILNAAADALEIEGIIKSGKWQGFVESLQTNALEFNKRASEEERIGNCRGAIALREQAKKSAELAEEVQMRGENGRSKTDNNG